jgi:phosphoenolpyruvate synthase/pyruvate phosphate dikinase
VLEPADLARLAELGCVLEEYFGGPQDVEWAIEGDVLYLLQSRPVTTL